MRASRSSVDSEISVATRPSISSQGMRKSSAAAALQAVMRKPMSVAMIASAEQATSAASCERSASAARWAVTSRAMVDAPTMLPSTSRIADTVSETGTREPSRRSRSVTNCSMCSPLEHAPQELRVLVEPARRARCIDIG